MSDELSRTPLYDLHIELGARMVPFAGWEMPVQYSGIIEEHLAVRNKAGLFDVSHMGEARIRGKDAAAFLDAIMTNEFSSLQTNHARYTIMCYPDGGCVDDLIIYRISKDEFLICLNASNAAKDIAWMNSQVGKWDVQIIDECSQWAQLALQGPFAEKILSSLTNLKLDTLKRFGFLTGQVAGTQNCIVARTGYTGSPGFEIYVPASQGPTVARAILEKGKPDGLLPIGLGARDSLRLEAGYPLYGHELSEKISPIQAGLSWTVKFSKPQFIGRDSLLRQTENGVVSKVMMYSLNDRRIARPGATVFSGDQAVGEILSGTLSPILNKPIGTALVTHGVNPDTLTVDIRGTHLPLQITQTPFFK